MGALPLSILNAIVSEPALRAKYLGPKAFAVFVIDSAANPEIKIGTSDVSLADAATNSVVAIQTIAGTTMEEVRQAIINVDNGVQLDANGIDHKDFDVQLLNSLGTDEVFDAGVAKFAADTGDINLSGVDWGLIMNWVNTATSVSFNTLRVPFPGVLRTTPALNKISGIGSDAGGGTVTRTIHIEKNDATYDTQVVGSGTTAASIEFDLIGNTQLFDGPIIIRDVNSVPGDVTETSLSVLWAQPGNFVSRS